MTTAKPTNAPRASKGYDTLLFIMRGQPIHNGHMHVIREAAKHAKQVLVLLGSANAARSPENPFTYDERAAVLKDCADHELMWNYGSVLTIRPLDDYMYNDDLWIASVQATVAGVTKPDDKIGLVGYAKDRSSYYLKMFPNYGSVAIPAQWGTINATQIRSAYFQHIPSIPDSMWMPEPQRDFLKTFALTPEFKWLLDEAEFYKDYRKPFEKFKMETGFIAPINCVDAVATQSGQILLVKRRKSPGKGLWALPGGHVEEFQTFNDAVLAELLQETQISDGLNGPKAMPQGALSQWIRSYRIFDDPRRSLRGRVITMAYRFEFPKREKLFDVIGADDAEHAEWRQLGTIDPRTMFEDHAHIIREMTGIACEGHLIKAPPAEPELDSK